MQTFRNLNICRFSSLTNRNDNGKFTERRIHRLTWRAQSRGRPKFDDPVWHRKSRRCAPVAASESFSTGKRRSAVFCPGGHDPSTSSAGRCTSRLRFVPCRATKNGWRQSVREPVMTTRHRTLLSIMLAFAVALSGLGAGRGPTEVVICGDDGPRTVVVDAAGSPVDQNHEPSCCDGPCIACAGCADPAAVLTVTGSTLSTDAAAVAGHIALEAVPALRRGGPKARAPPKGRS